MTDSIKCSFCPNTRSDVKKIIAGPDLGDETVYICEECIEVGYRAISPKVIRRPTEDNPTPVDIKHYLDSYIIEQSTAKEALAVARFLRTAEEFSGMSTCFSWANELAKLIENK